MRTDYLDVSVSVFCLTEETQKEDILQVHPQLNQLLQDFATTN